jgi:flagellar biosynthetic protein FliQ
MTQQAVVQIFHDMLMTTFWVSVPLLGLGFVAGIVISVVQIVTSMQDSAVGSIPRLVAFFAGVLLFLPWMIMRLVTYTTVLFGDFSKYAR